MFLLLAVIALFMDLFEKRAIFTETAIASWIHALVIGLAVIAYFTSDIGDELVYYATPVEAENWVLAGIIVLLVSMLWKKLIERLFPIIRFMLPRGFI